MTVGVWKIQGDVSIFFVIFIRGDFLFPPQVSYLLELFLSLILLDYLF